MKTQSLVVSLSWSLSLGLLVFAVLQWLLVTQLMRHLTYEEVGSRLGHDGESLIQALQFSPDQLPLLSPDRLDPIFNRPFSGHYFILDARGIQIHSRSLWTYPLKTSPDQSLQLISGPLQQQLLVSHQSVLKNNVRVSLTVAEDISPLQRTLRRFGWLYALFSAVMTVLLLSLQNWLLLRLLAPLLRTRAELERLAQEEIQMLDEAVPRELKPLVESFNSLLKLQQQRLTRARDSLADLSHGLKRPLSRMRQLLEEQPWPELSAETEVIRERIERQLAHARQAGASPLLKPLLVKDLLAEILPVLEKLYAYKNLVFDTQVSEQRLLMERQDALELLGNLLDNACKWAHHQVVIQVDADQGITISDDGPGVDPEFRNQISQRGLRADQQVPGHGLGLAIAQDLAQSYGGELSFLSCPSLGGLLVRLSGELVVSQPSSRGST